MTKIAWSMGTGTMRQRSQIYYIYVQDRLNKGDYNLTKIAWSMGQLVRRGLNNMIDD